MPCEVNILLRLNKNRRGKRETRCSTPEMNCTRDQIKSWLALTLVKRRRGDGDRLRSLDRGQINYRLVQNRQAGRGMLPREKSSRWIYIFSGVRRRHPFSPKTVFVGNYPRRLETRRDTWTLSTRMLQFCMYPYLIRVLAVKDPLEPHPMASIPSY